jgi:hypothetical protein
MEKVDHYNYSSNTTSKITIETNCSMTGRNEVRNAKQGSGLGRFGKYLCVFHI